MIVEREEPGHICRVNGVIVPSVTQILRFLSREKQDAAPTLRRDAAADRGKRAHEYCQLLDYDALPKEIDADCVGYVTAYRAFVRDFRAEWLHSELLLWCEEFAGEIDRVGMIDGKLTIADLKCTATLDRRTTAAQIAGGYRKLWIHRFGTEPEAFIPIHLKKDGTYSAKPLTDKEIKLGRSAFNSCLWLNKYLKGELN